MKEVWFTVALVTGRRLVGLAMAFEQASASSAFEEQLRTLCLKEFPCGNGPWKKPMTIKTYPLPGKKTLRIGDKTETEFSNTLADYGAEYDHTETLREYVTAKHSPWTFDYSWSDEAKALRELAVESPDDVNTEFVYKHFRTLRILNRGITDIDKKLLQFENLVELTLSANNLKHVHSQFLPRSLKVLELCANEISDLFSLCLEAPALVHLGLGYNRLTYIDDFLSGDHWPQLLSLDLSYNNLTDLVEAIRKLQTLPKLNNLILKGNPLSLSPAYRGYVIDKLKGITIFDDIIVEAQERHEYRAMSKMPDSALNMSILTLEAKALKNIPMPMELRSPEEQAEYPVITRNYYIDFHYLGDTLSELDDFHANGKEENFDSDSMSASRNEFEYQSQSGERTPTGTSHSRLSKGFRSPETHNDVAPGHVHKHDSKGIIRTSKGIWSESIELGWNETVCREDLLAMRDFLQGSMAIDVVEETILSFPKEDPEKSEDAHSKGNHSAAKDKKKKEEPKDVKKDDKKGKKKKDNDIDMRHDPPKLTLLASFSISLATFLEGESIYVDTLTKDFVQSRAPSVAAQSVETQKKDKDKKKGTEEAKKPKEKEAGKQMDKTKSAKAKDGKETKQPPKKDEKSDQAGALVDEPDTVTQPPPLELTIGITLHRWSSTLDAEANIKSN